MTDGPTLDELRAELHELRCRQHDRDQAGRMLGVGAKNLSYEVDLAAEIQRDVRAAELARIAELEAAIAQLEADRPGSQERLKDVWGQLQTRHTGRQAL